VNGERRRRETHTILQCTGLSQSRSAAEHGLGVYCVHLCDLRMQLHGHECGGEGHALVVDEVVRGLPYSY
jgi:hypothetical protein